VAPQMGKEIVDAYLSHSLGDGYEWWPNFYEFHKLACDELKKFDYEKFKENGFKINKLGDYQLELMEKPKYI
jgi:ribose 5-phosphate isomerase B